MSGRTVRKLAGVALGVAAGAAGIGAYALLRRPLPRVKGTVRIPALAGPVEVIRDRWGVPHIMAQSATDLFLAQGYVHAQDRLWQMEFQRRAASGRLSEIFGAVALDSDRFIRILGFTRVVERETALLSAEVAGLVDAYARGVNAFIDQHRHRLPIEFTLLRIDPRPWTTADVLVWSKMMALQLAGNWRSEILRARMVAAVGADRAAALEPQPGDGPLIVPPGARYTADLGAAALQLAAGARRYLADVAGQGSNSWVVAGARSTSGAPLLANDPHLAVTIPALWYENHLHGGGFHVTGASIPGMPGVIIGHNEHIAWGVTNGMNDVQDLYLERFDPQDSTGRRYEVDGTWQQAELVREEIVVRGRAEVHIEDVLITRHGPIINRLIGAGATEAPLALRWTALQPGRLFEAAFNLNRAHDWDSFRTALRDWSAPAQNFSYADMAGHVGYQLAGDIPRRPRHDGRLPVPGWVSTYEWDGMVPPEALPHAYDPADGLIVHANNRIVADESHIPGEYLNGYRADRIRELLLGTERHDRETFARIHADRYSVPGMQIAALVGRLPTPTLIARQARAILAAWDGDLTADSAAGLIYAHLRQRLLKAAFADVAATMRAEIGLGAFASLPGYDFMQRTLPQLLDQLAAGEPRMLPPGTTIETVLAEAWATALSEIVAEHGSHVEHWRFGTSHRLDLRHALGSLAPLSRLLNRGPFPLGGDLDTVNMANFPREYAGLPAYVAPSYRQICDLHDWDQSRSIQPVGQSGQPGSPHYADFVQPGLEVRYDPRLWSRASIAAAAVATLWLEPGR